MRPTIRMQGHTRSPYGRTVEVVTESSAPTYRLSSRQVVKAQVVEAVVEVVDHSALTG